MFHFNQFITEGAHHQKTPESCDQLKMLFLSAWKYMEIQPEWMCFQKDHDDNELDFGNPDYSILIGGSIPCQTNEI